VYPISPPVQPANLEQPHKTATTPSPVGSPVTLSTPACFILSLLLPIFALAPLFYPGYIQVHSGLVPLWNIADLRANLSQLNWLPHLALRFDPLRGEGLLLYYLAALLPLNPATAIKLSAGLAWVAGSAGIFLWLRRWLGGSGALITALVYTYLPYRLSLVYVRGAWGENLFWSLLPWALLAATYLATASKTSPARSELPNSHDKRNIQAQKSLGSRSEHASRQMRSGLARAVPHLRMLHSSMGQPCMWVLPFLAGTQRALPKLLLLPASLLWLLLGLSQLGLTLWALLLTLLLLLVLHRPHSLWPALSALAGVTAAIAIYLLPEPHTLFMPAPAPFADHFLYPSQLFSAYWGFGPSRPGWNDDLSLQLGLAAFGLALLTLFLQRPTIPPEAKTAENQPSPPVRQTVSLSASVETKNLNRRASRLLFFWSAAILLTLLQFQPAQLLWSLPIWPGQSLAATLTYPWQLLGLIGLCLAVLAGAAIWLAPETQFTQLPLFGSILLIIMLSVYPYLSPQFIRLDPYPPDKPQAELGQAQLVILDHSFSVVTSGHTAGLEVGETAIPLAAYGPLQANDILVLNLTWQPLQPFQNDLKVFAHLVAPDDAILAQFDGQPKEGAYPTSRWIPGEIITDAYPIRLPPDLPPGPYRLFIGLYDEPTLQRLPVPTDPAGRVIFNVQ
jgi:hypothetical protein